VACSKCEARRQALFSEIGKMQGFAAAFTDWIKKPYDDDMTALDWFLFVGLIIVVIFAWTSILNKVLD
jgi:hypothetical protein